MAQQYPEWIWQNGTSKPWREATTHVMSHALHYGSSVFEGIRSYATPDGTAISRLSDHLKRLYQSALIYDMVLPYSQDELAAACREVIKKNGLTAAYLRPVAYRGLGGIGLSAETPIDVAVAARPAASVPAKASRWPTPACAAMARAITCSGSSTACCTPRGRAPPSSPAL